MIHSASTDISSEIISEHTIAEVILHHSNGQHSLHAMVPFSAGDVISSFTAGETFEQPNYLTVQKGLSEHITLLPSFLQYINHSCNPNVFFDTTQMKLIALKPIAPHEELCFFYPSTELDMAQPFICFCGSKNCLQNIKGALHTPLQVMQQYRVTAFISNALGIKKSQSQA